MNAMELMDISPSPRNSRILTRTVSTPDPLRSLRKLSPTPKTFARSVSDALQKSSSDKSLIGDFSKVMIGIHVIFIQGDKKQQQQAMIIMMAQMLRGELKLKANFTIVDCRYPYEYEAGHIRGAKNIFTRQALEDMFLSTSSHLSQVKERAHILVFHCEFSSERAPSLGFVFSQSETVQDDLNYLEDDDTTGLPCTFHDLFDMPISTPHGAQRRGARSALTPDSGYCSKEKAKGGATPLVWNVPQGNMNAMELTDISPRPRNSRILTRTVSTPDPLRSLRKLSPTPKTFARSVSDALQKSSSDKSLIGDFSKMAQMLRGELKLNANFTIVDCRYPYEFEAGHIRGAKNIFTRQALEDMFLSTSSHLTQVKERAHILVFHCEFSSERAPSLQSQTFTKVCLDHGAMINESCTPIPHSMRSDVDLHAASPVAQNKQGRVQDLASKQLSILQCNINGLCSTATKIKLEEIMEIAEKQKIQIIALQETKLNEKYNLKYKNYNILRKDRNKEGGGLAFLIKNLYYEDIAINIPNTSDLEAQGIKVYLNQNKTINIFNMYHPPNNKLIDDGTMAQFLTDNTIIVGDLNAKHQLWGCSTPNPRGKILSNLFDDNAFMCLNDGNPTHHSYSYNTAQALDISFSSPDIFHKCKWQILKSIGSDHLPILIEISTKTKTSSIKEKFWNFKKANWNLYQQNTNEDFRKAPTRIKDLEQNWISFKNTIIKAAKVSIPRGNIKKWIPNYTHQAKDIQTLITKRNELQKKCTQNQTNCRTELNIVNAKIKRLYVNMKREKWKQTCENLNPRNPNTKLWHLAKQIDRAQPQTENTNIIKNTDGTPATNDKNAANLLGNSYQISSKIKFEIKDKKVEKKARKIIHDCKNVTSTHNIFHEKINMKELDYALENTDLNKTPGPDGIHGQMISNLGKNGKEKLLYIFNNSWKTGKLPQDWKTATIIPIKKLDKSADDPKNYRPISLTSICCKLMEKIILRRLTYHLDTRNLLPKEQYGFRKGHGTIDQLLFFTQKRDREINEKYYPLLLHPELYILDGGYKAFYQDFQDLCEPPHYKPMLHEDHTSDLKKFRSKSKSHISNGFARGLKF
ncbi:hypothetical protein LAZ67_6000181 [Cordylochernes scorpioides]|uniref:protein-tyrosine-phosphatase n=1 Tax=Cordylochernes scorpioides TaxID=51811 RepID=A0ABY6KJ06_9ARAC|nr:hypothetical protein LAZ67_6000181 [Cordylochernes scorpioides]